MLRLRVVLVVAVVALGVVIVPGTEALPTVEHHASAAQLPALRSAPVAKPVLDRPTGRSSALVHGTRVAGFRAADVNNPPPATTAVSPDDGATVTTVMPTLTVAGVTDPEGDTVSYRFKVTTKADAETGTIVADTAVVSTSFPLPDGALKDGVTYFWHVYAADALHQAGTAPGWVRSFRVDLRLGQRSTFPFDSVGPASVNLANGNLVVAASSASVSALSGSVGVGLVYNSSAPSQPGLIGTYTADANGNHVVDTGEDPAVVRRDPSITFDWGTGSPAPGLPATNVLAKWVGYVTAPAGSYKFGATTSDGVKITVGSTVVVDSWVTHAVGAPVYDTAVSLGGGAPTPITIEWFKGATAGAVLKLYVKGDGSTTTLAEQLVDPSWLSSEAGALSKGWTLSPLGAGLSYVRAEVSDSKVVLIGPDGDTHVYTSTGTGYTPPKDEDGILARDNNGLLTLDSSDGTTYVFDATGALVSATSSSGAKPASLRYAWSTPSGLLLPRLTEIIEPVADTPTSHRRVVLRYGGGGSCPGSAPSGFDSAAPAGMLCSVELWDGRVTKLWYVAGRLARIENPGAEVTDFAYDSSGRLAKVRDPLAADLVAAGLRTDDDTTRTLLSYDSNGRASSVTLGEPTAGASRPGHSYDYTSATEVRTHVAGLTEPSGWARKVTMDGVGRQLTDTDATNRTTTYVWDAADRVVSTTDPAGLRSTTFFDWAGRPIESYGPAPAARFGSDNKPLAGYVGQVAKSTIAYDEGMKGLDALYFDNRAFAGEPVGHQLGIGDATGALDHVWTSLPPGVTSSEWSARLTGELVMDLAGSYTISPNVAGRARIYLDDVLVLDTASAPSATYTNTTMRHRVRVEYTNVGPSWLTLTSVGASSWTVPAGVTSVTAEAWGAQGGDGWTGARIHDLAGGTGGSGGYAKATIPVTAAESLSVRVGGRGPTANGETTVAGGFNGGAEADSLDGTGGGASDVRRGGTTLADRVLVAGGGGGGAFSGDDWGSTLKIAANGGAGGAAAGASGGNGGGTASDHCGTATTGGSGGSGGTWLAGGAGGVGGSGSAPSGFNGQPGNAGSLGAGGSSLGGGGGGGGFYGGGGGGLGGWSNCSYQNWAGNGAGGGGSNLVTGTGTVSTAGVRSGDGQVQLSWIGALSSASLDLHWTPPSGTDVRVPGTALTPRYGLASSSVDPDGRKVATEYGAPETGLATASVVDPAGLGLRSKVAFEAPGTGFFRPVSRSLPKDSTSPSVTYGYYGGTEARTNPCPAGGSAVQAGLRKLSTDAAIQREVVYDDAGRVVASRVVGDSGWSCVTYDARGRVTSSADRLGAATTIDHLTTAGTVTASFPDSAGVTRSTVSVVDLLGRTVRSTDELGTLTRVVFDQPGRATATYRTLSGGAEVQVTSATYDAAGRVVSQSDHLSGTARTTTYGYDSTGRPASMARPNGVSTDSSYTVDGRLAGLSHSSAASTTTHTQTFTSAQTWTVPAGVSTVKVEAWGAQGGDGGTNGAWGGHPGVGGLGGYARGTIAVASGESLVVKTGGQGGTNAAGANGGGSGAAGGGGASDVRRGGSALADRVIVAGGGGGGGGAWTSSTTTYGGNGGSSGVAGLPGTMNNTNQPYAYPGGGGGGPGGAGGSGGAGWASNGWSGTAGTAGQGGTSGDPAGGGGGGGYLGGGGGGGGGGHGGSLWPAGYGGSGGGGGGSNYVIGSATAPTTSDGVRSGSGQVILTWTTSSLPVANYTYSLGGRITQETAGTVPDRQRDFTYDGAGRLTTTVEGSTTRRYAYDANTNRCGLATACESTVWQYDAADRITKSPYAAAYTYDAHGNVTATTATSGNLSATIAHDANDHATVVNDGTTTVTETLAPSGRVLRRVVTTNATGAVVEDVSYGYAGGGDSPAYSRPTAGSTITTYLTGIGGLVDVAGTAMWSLYNAHGDILGTTNAAGTFTAAPVADELGVGTTSTSRLGWLGQQQRPSVGGALGVMRMGVRLYDPRLGRFLEVDPVAGGSANDYDYCAGDPVNCFDLAGTMKTPENKAASNDLGTFLRWYSGLTKQQQQGMQQLLAGAMRMVQSPAPPAPTSRRGPDPSAPGGDGGPRGLPSANGGPRGQQPPPSSPRDYHPPSVGCIASGVGVATGVLGLAIATDGASLLLSGVGGGASGVGIVTSC